MKSRYLIRFDDICPTMNWDMWQRVEALLKAHDVRPILAVVPDNQDPELQISAPAADFWERVRHWQAGGWSIALHGYQHKFLGAETGRDVAIGQRSEFAELSEQAQRTKLQNALEHLHREKIAPQLWAAPWHSFDENTLKVLRDFNLNVVSDGMFLWPKQDRNGTFWIPQQLDDFRRLPFGVFTVCFHLNEWNEMALQAFEKHLLTYHAQIVSLDEILTQYQQRRSWFSVSAWHKAGNNFVQLKKSLRLRSRVMAAKNFYRKAGSL